MSDSMSSVTSREEEGPSFEGPPTKKLRSCEPDLTVVVGQGDSKKTYVYHSQIMASYSSFVDIALATPMRESENMTITFPEIESEEWEAMIGYLQPFATPPSTAFEVLRVLPWYAKYQFTAGFEMCDRFLSKLSFDIEDFSKVDVHVQAVGAAYKHSMPLTRENGKEFAKQVFRNRTLRSGLTPEMISALLPVITEDKGLWKRLSLMMGPLSLSQNKEAIITNPLFPDLLAQVLRSHDLEGAIEKNIRYVKVRQAGMQSVNGNYIREANQRRAMMYVKEGQNPGDTDYCIQQLPNRGTAKTTWILFSRPATAGTGLAELPGVQQNLYKCTDEFASKLPPRFRWKPYSQNIPAPAPFLKFD